MQCSAARTDCCADIAIVFIKGVLNTRVPLHPSFDARYQHAIKETSCIFQIWLTNQVLTVMLFFFSFECRRRGQYSSVSPAFAMTRTTFRPLTLILLSSGFTSYRCQLHGPCKC